MNKCIKMGINLSSHQNYKEPSETDLCSLLQQVDMVRSKWFLDSDCSKHMTGDECLFNSITYKMEEMLSTETTSRPLSTATATNMVNRLHPSQSLLHFMSTVSLGFALTGRSFLKLVDRFHHRCL
ncbi:uncharacterized protein LOC127805979 isoform X2 [Diospyros lotus]|uniref:uncharacterized protein LOC127805979 isoform X2 n=1 Tax=Diospyros lotus TaxID=55363 RepID=UPI00225A1E27|nr:uncharacterized protein LOC127805979 isoform X2 [Diospyros lotus]